jgi:hypothetical protein
MTKDDAGMQELVNGVAESIFRDAARYRFLRDGCGDKSIGVYTVAWSAEERTWLSGQTLDAAIDAALNEDSADPQCPTPD